MNTMDLSGQTAVVTGGASGIGEGIVRAFVAAGASVFVGDIDEERGQDLASTLGASAVFLRTDVTREADVAALIGRAANQAGQLDCVVNNAGALGPYLSIADHEAAEVDRQTALLLKSVIWGIKHASLFMLPRRRGSIINTASVAGLTAGFGPHIYTALKHAVVGLTRSTATELAAHFIRVNAICPGGVLTRLAIDAAGGGAEGERWAREYLAGLQPMPLVGMPEDVAAAAVFLAGDGSRFVTGQAITIDGAATAGRAWRTDFG